MRLMAARTSSISSRTFLEHFSVNTLDEDTECLVEVVPDKDERALLLVDVAGAFETEGASPLSRGHRQPAR